MRQGFQLLVVACASAWATPARADGVVAGGTAEPDWSVTLQISMGYAYERVAPADPNGIDAGFALLVRRGMVAAGPLVVGAAGGIRDSGYFGLAAGAVLDPAPWARIELLAEGGAHRLAIENDYAFQPAGVAWLPYAGVRAAVVVLGNVVRSPYLMWARRAGIGIQVSARADLSRPSVQLTYPPELGLPPTVVGVGGHALSVALVLPLEW
jgi:hypothetical protein